MFYKMWTEQNRLFCKSQLLDMLPPPKNKKKEYMQLAKQLHIHFRGLFLMKICRSAGTMF